jgi:hypothetical protein
MKISKNGHDLMQTTMLAICVFNRVFSFTSSINIFGLAPNSNFNKRDTRFHPVAKAK